MNNVYTPDKWVVLRITDPETNQTIDKVLGAWYGGFAGSDHWQLNSGIKLVDEHSDRFEFHGYSGSIYVCYKPCWGFTSLSNGIYKSLVTKGVPVQILEEYDVRPKR